MYAGGGGAASCTVNRADLQRSGQVRSGQGPAYRTDAQDPQDTQRVVPDIQRAQRVLAARQNPGENRVPALFRQPVSQRVGQGV